MDYSLLRPLKPSFFWASFQNATCWLLKLSLSVGSYKFFLLVWGFSPKQWLTNGKGQYCLGVPIPNQHQSCRCWKYLTWKQCGVQAPGILCLRNRKTEDSTVFHLLLSVWQSQGYVWQQQQLLHHKPIWPTRLASAVSLHRMMIMVWKRAYKDEFFAWLSQEWQFAELSDVGCFLPWTGCLLQLWYLLHHHHVVFTPQYHTSWCRRHWCFEDLSMVQAEWMAICVTRQASKVVQAMGITHDPSL